MKLAAEKNLNKYVFPIFSIKGRKITYPYKIEMGSYGLLCENGAFGASNWMIMDILGTYIIHKLHNNREGKVEFKHKIPTSMDSRVKKTSSLYISEKLLKHLANRLSPADQGIIPQYFYSGDVNLQEIDPLHNRMKKPQGIKITDSYLKEQVPILSKYSSNQIHGLIKSTSEWMVRMNYPIRFFDGKNYQNFSFNNYKIPCTLFRLLEVRNSKVSKDGHILEREYSIRFDTLLGYFYVQNCLSCYVDLLPDKFYLMSDYAQLFYRMLILPYFDDFKNPIGIEEVRKRLVLKTKDTYMVRKVVKRILDELESNSYIKEPREDKLNGKYAYSYKKSTWKEINE